MTTEDVTLLRSKQSYDNDVKTKNFSVTGIKEVCVFNEFLFHVTVNTSADVMHDIFEGVGNIIMATILLQLILVDKCFPIDYLNNALNSLDFAFEKSNVPLNISLEYLKSNKRLKMSASETLFFIRYFGLLVGDMVPEDNKNWSLYIKLREIIHIITSSTITHSHLTHLKILIEEHHKLFIKIFDVDLKAKFYFMVHYNRLILQNGPLINTSSLRFESKHTEIKSILNAISSNKNILLSAGIRLQLRLMHFVFLQYRELYSTYGPEIQDDSVNIHFPVSICRIL